MSARPTAPTNITAVTLPATCPELNPQDRVWAFTRDHWLSNRVFTGSNNLVDHRAGTWNKGAAQPWRTGSDQGDLAQAPGSDA